MIIRTLILCSYWLSACAWAGFFHINADNAMSVNSVNGVGGATALEQAHSSILAHGTELGIDVNATVLFQRANTDSFGNQHLRFKLAYRGIKVENAQIIVHFDQGNVRSLSGYRRLLSDSFKNKIDTHLSQGKTQLTAGEVLAFINQRQHRVLSNKPMIVQSQPHVIWRVRLLIDGIANVYDISDSKPPQILSTTMDIQY